ncbi:hypothetical protein [Arthrobacter sp. Ld5]|uniref:hypothetical protein n=1 Tax=Arthrobacter sp. Ld5 TaxID=649152 RepID=UPI003EBACE3C
MADGVDGSDTAAEPDPVVAAGAVSRAVALAHPLRRARAAAPAKSCVDQRAVKGLDFFWPGECEKELMETPGAGGDVE